MYTIIYFIKGSRVNTTSFPFITLAIKFDSCNTFEPGSSYGILKQYHVLACSNLIWRMLSCGFVVVSVGGKQTLSISALI